MFYAENSMQPARGHDFPHWLHFALHQLYKVSFHFNIKQVWEVYIHVDQDADIII